jgi:hypothetical protein
LKVRLLDRDLIIVGYATDWDYLNDALAAVLGAARPARVIVVNPDDGVAFERKAPVLYQLGQRASTSFAHVRSTASAFLAALRLAFSKSFVRRILYAGADEYRHQTGVDPHFDWTEPPNVDNDTFWKMRRDLEGRLPTEPAQAHNPPDEPLIGLTLLQLQARGAIPDGSYWLLDGHRIRVLRGLNTPLHRVQMAFEREVAPIIAPDIVVVVGAEAHALPANIARGETRSTIARGTASRWMTRLEAVEILGL